MNTKHLNRLALGAAIAGSLAAVSVAQANPFSLTTLGSAYMAADGDADPKKAEGEMKCGEGKCGGKKDAAGDKAKGEMKCGEGKCGGKKDGARKEGEKKEGEKQPEPM
jgi:uncharacterized low-complexity protein